jgi:hypothetical protein
MNVIHNNDEYDQFIAETDYDQFISILPYESKVPAVHYLNGKYYVTQKIKQDCTYENFDDNMIKNNSYIDNIYRDGLLCIFSCFALSTFYTISFIYSFYRKA